AASRRRSTRGTGSPTRRSGGPGRGPARPSSVHERVLLAQPQRRSRVVDEAALVVEQLQGGGAPVVGRGGGGHLLGAVPPQLGGAVEGLRRAATLRQRRVHHMVERVGLHVAPDAQDGGVAPHQRPVRLAPVALELLARQRRQAPETEDELHHWRGWLLVQWFPNSAGQSKSPSHLRLTFYPFRPRAPGGCPKSAPAGRRRKRW